MSETVKKPVARSRYLSKIILVLEPTLVKENFHYKLREFTLHNKSNLLNYIGVDPMVFRTESSKGAVDLQIWVASYFGSPLSQLIFPFYFVGARKYLFISHSKNCLEFISKTLDLAGEKINALYELVILTPSNEAKKTYLTMKNAVSKFLHEKNLQHYSFHQWSSNDDLIKIFKTLVEDIVTNIPQEPTYIPIGFELSTVESIAKKQGFEVNDQHEILAKIDSINDILFRVNLKNNNVYAEKTNCLNCPKDCKVSKKLCIEIADKGYSNFPGLGDIRIISILMAIKDMSILTIKGTKPQEDVNAQIKNVRETWDKICKNKV